MIHGVLGEAQGQQLPSRGAALVFFLAGLAVTAWSWIVLANFRGLGDRMLKDSRESARAVPLTGPALRRASMRLLGSQENIDKAGRLGYRATAWVFAIAGPVILFLMVATLLVR
jgi:Tfp pilus assembly protein PilX